MYILVFVESCAPIVPSKRKDEHYYITSLFNTPMTLPLSLFLFISLSLCLLPSLLCFIHTHTHTYISFVQFPWWQPRLELKSFKRQRQKEKSDGKRESEDEVERGSVKQKKEILAQECIVFTLPCFLFSLSLPPPQLPPCFLRLPCFLVFGARGRSKFNSLMCD